MMAGDLFGERESDLAILSAIETRIAAAHARYGDFASTHEALGVAVEEWDELRDAIRENKLASVEWECLDLAAVLIRLARNLQTSAATRRRSFK